MDIVKAVRCLLLSLSLYRDACLQDELLQTLQAAGPSVPVTDLMSFWRPKAAHNSKQSNLLMLGVEQINLMYALACCADVKFLVGQVSTEVSRGWVGFKVPRDC